jgi:tetratricopeptide (TPR) repeat protein
LVQLAHPHIVRVFDYGVDPSGPFYTMEVLEGCNARDSMRKQPLEVRAVCVLLRDLASALALIHSRRLAHRDLSPRNVWCTPDGRARLIDFGTLAPLGVQSGIAGTPPFVPPEAVHLQPLDARSDVYALGALAYYLLVRRNAYPARRVRDLRKLWQRRPATPIALRPDLPPALSELVMQMLSLDPRGRPMSAGEVYDRLSSIGDLPVEDDRRIAQAFLTTPTSIGRDAQRVRVRGHLLELMRGRGGTLPIVAAAGLGRTRMLASVVLDAKVMGAAVVTVAAGATAGAPLAAAVALAEQLVETLATLPQLRPEHASTLAELSPSLRRAFGEAPPQEATAQDRRRRAVPALIAFAEAVSAEQPLLVAVDDVHRVDDASLAVFAQLSLLTARRRLLVCATCDEAALAEPTPALAQLVRRSNALTLAPLSLAETHALLAAVFGDVPSLEPVARFLHELAEGNPRACMSYAQYLVDGGFARFEAGQWRLPERVRACGLPETLSAMFDARVAALSEDARALALGFALGRDATRATWQPENNVHVEDFAALLEPAESGDASARAFMALDELLRAGLLEQHGAHYSLTQTAVVDALLSATGNEARTRAHARLATVFGRPGAYVDPYLAVRHLQAAGHYELSREALVRLAADAARGTVNWDWGAIRISVAAACARRQLEHFAQHGGTRRDGIVLRRLLMTTCSVADWRIAHVGDQQVPELCAAVGLGHLETLAPDLTPEARLSACMQLAEQAFAETPQLERGSSPAQAARELAACALPLSGAFVNSHDLVRAERLMHSFAPLRPFSPLHDVLADLCALAVDRVRGRALGERLLEGGTRLYASTGLPDVLRKGGTGVYLQVQALEDARRGRKRALDLMDVFAKSAGDGMFIVVHGRWLGHAYRGDAAAERAFRPQVEIVTEDDIWRRKAYLFVEAELHALTGDLASLVRTGDAIAELAEHFEGWMPWRAYCRGEALRLRGELDEARVELQAALAAAQPGMHRAYTVVAPAHAELLLALGRHAEAECEAAAVVERAVALDLDPCTRVSAGRVRALALSALGRHDDARSCLVDTLALARELDFDGLPLARLHLSEARVALAAGAVELADTALELTLPLIQRAEAPALFGAYESLRAEAAAAAHAAGRTPSAKLRPEQLAVPDEPAVEPEPLGAEALVASSRATIVSRRPRRPIAFLAAAATPAARAQAALALLLEESEAQAGHLLLFGVGGISVAASIGVGAASEELLTWAQQYVDHELGGSRRTQSTTPSLLAASTPPPLPVTPSADCVDPCLLLDLANGTALFVGLALLVAPRAPLALQRSELVHAVSRALLEAGDCVPLALET